MKGIRTKAARIALLALWLVVDGESPAASSDSDTLSMDEIVDILEKAQSQNLSGRGRLRTTVEFNENLLKDLSESEVSFVKATVRDSYGLDDIGDLDLTITGNKIRLQGDSMTVGMDKSGTERRDRFLYTFDGSVGRFLLLDGKEGFIYRNAKTRHTLLRRDPARFGKVFLPEMPPGQRKQLREAIRKGISRLLPGGNIVEVQYADPWQPYTRTIQVDLGRGGLVILERTQFRDSDTLSEEVRSQKVVQLSNGDWVALDLLLTDFADKSSEPLNTVHWIVEDFTEDLEIPGSEFTFDFPMGTLVHDEIAGVDYLWPDKNEEENTGLPPLNMAAGPIESATLSGTDVPTVRHGGDHRETPVGKTEEGKPTHEPASFGLFWPAIAAVVVAGWVVILRRRGNK